MRKRKESLGITTTCMARRRLGVVLCSSQKQQHAIISVAGQVTNDMFELGTPAPECGRACACFFPVSSFNLHFIVIFYLNKASDQKKLKSSQKNKF